MGRVEWALTEKHRVEQEARVLAAAVFNARERAQTMATAAGLGEVHCLEVSDPGMLSSRARVEHQFDSGGPAALRAAMPAGAPGSSSSGSSVSPEDIEFWESVHARFAADQARQG
ncbi:SIMPL domain-containing protein [Aestuariimicrobium ganziense]|uniref:SIMPL domain-containing protein n=1 Tax=Aestuariimicrobium ganziense TaxID=2773677 RepID=UPI001940FCAD|nr:SIMPL domain-containing protein [Aestuariimicrobium ganziense]